MTTNQARTGLRHGWGSRLHAAVARLGRHQNGATDLAARVARTFVRAHDAAGTVTIHHYPDEPYLTTTATEFPHHAPYVELQVPVETGDSYAERHDIDTIDLLKIDVEGAEPSVLRGFSTMLGRGAIGAIQFEYGVVAVIDKFLMSDFYALLGGYGYEIGPLRTDGVWFQPYDLGVERFIDVNFVAVHESRPDLRARVSRPH